MKGMARIRAPRRSSLQCSLHVSTARLNDADTLTTAQNKSSAPQKEMNFMKAAEILFSEDKSNRRKKFGWDFHLWQAFVACLPSVAIYLTAQYARYDMEKVRAKIEEINAEKLKNEEEKQEQEAQKVPGFQKIEGRLDKLEEKISNIESTAAKAKAAAMDDESKAGKVKDQEDKVIAGGADTAAQETKNAEAPGNAAQNNFAKEGSEEAHGSNTKKVDPPRPPPKAA